MLAASLRLGLIGAGRWGRNYIRTIAGLDSLRLAGLASNNPECTQWVPRECHITSDWRTILDSRLIDGVIIATPPHLHIEMACAAVRAGIPVLVEKPLALDSAQAGKLRDLVAEHDGFVMVGHTHLFHPAFRQLKAVAPKYGKIRSIDSEAGNFGPFRTDTPVLWDWGSHDVAMCLDLLGSIPDQVVSRRIETRMVPEGLGEIVEIELKFPQGVGARIRVGNVMPKKRYFRALMEKAALVYDDLNPNPLTAYLAPEFATALVLQSGDEKPLTKLVVEFAAAIRERRKDRTSLELGVAVVNVLQECAADLR